MAADAPTPIRLRRPGTGRTLVRCMRYLRPYWRHTIGAYVLLLANNGINLAMPLIIGAIIDRGFENDWVRPHPPSARTGKR